MHIWRDIWPELSVAFYLLTWVVVLLLTHMLSR
jgi:hypothetical protein